MKMFTGNYFHKQKDPVFMQNTGYKYIWNQYGSIGVQRDAL